MRVHVLAAALMIGGMLSGCAGGGERTGAATAMVPDGDYATIFRNITSAAVSAGFTITSAQLDSGQIFATEDSSHLLNNSDPNINIVVTRAGTGAQVAVSTVVQRSMSGRVIDAGDPRSSMRNFCAALGNVIPTATCVVQNDRPAKSR